MKRSSLSHKAEKANVEGVILHYSHSKDMIMLIVGVIHFIIDNK